MDRFGSVIDRMNMKLGSKFIYSLNIKTQLLKRLQRVIVLVSATHCPQKDGAEAFMPFLHGAQLVLLSSVLTVLDLNEVNVTL